MPAEPAGAAAGPWKCPACGATNPRSLYARSCRACGGARPSGEPAAAAGGGRIMLSSRRGRLVASASWAYALAVLITLGIMRFLGESWTPATFLMYGPRYVLLLPLPLLALAALVRRPRLLALQATTAMIVAGPYMNLALPVGRLLQSAPEGPRIRVLTFNRWVRPLDGRGLMRLIEREEIDVLCFQEGRWEGIEVIESLLRERGWRFHHSGRVASRLPVVADIRRGRDGAPVAEDWPRELYLMRLRHPSGREVLVGSLHLPSMRSWYRSVRSGDDDAPAEFQDLRAGEVERLLGVLAALAEDGVPIVLGGDFNMPRDSPLMDLPRRRFRVAQDEAGWGYGYTYSSTRPWIGIDHVLATPDCRFTACRVGPDLGSDHLPVIAELALPPPSP